MRGCAAPWYCAADVTAIVAWWWVQHNRAAAATAQPEKLCAVTAVAPDLKQEEQDEQEVEHALIGEEDEVEMARMIEAHNSRRKQVSVSGVSAGM